jgi:hypothetical protein
LELDGLTLLHVSRGGDYYRLADVDWRDPLDGSFPRDAGGRWNPPGSFPVVYLNATEDVARALVRARMNSVGIEPEEIDPVEGPLLVTAHVPGAEFVDIVTDEGCINAGLPVSYPLGPSGERIGHADCQPIGLRAWDTGEWGIACRSATQNAPSQAEELAWFERDDRLTASRARPFDEWY